MTPKIDPALHRDKKPDWIRVTLPRDPKFWSTKGLITDLKLHTVCEEAQCTNRWECWSQGTATFMIAGDRCTRACGFCAVKTAKPFALEADEPQRVAEATQRMGLNHIVITAVARDDVKDGGAEHFARTIEAVRAAVTSEGFKSSYADVFSGDMHWAAIGSDSAAMTYGWDDSSTYIQLPPYFAGMPKQPATAVPDIKGANILALLGDSITTDHISPAGNIAKTSPAAKYLQGRGVEPKDFNQYGARRGSHDVMMRGTFANIRIKNEMLGGKEGGLTKHWPDGTEMSIYDAAMEYKKEGVPLVVVGGKEYGTGSSRDWAAKGTNLQGVKAVLAESFERIHRSNLVGMGVLPLVFKDGMDRKSVGLDGSETIDILGLEAGLRPRMDLTCRITRSDGTVKEIPVLCRVDTLDEVDYYKNGGILQYVLRSLLKSAEPAGHA